MAERRHNAVIRCNRLDRVSTSYIHTTLPSSLCTHTSIRYFALLYSTQGYKVQVPCLKAGPPCTLVWLPSAQAGTTCTKPAVILRLRSGRSSVSFLWISGEDVNVNVNVNPIKQMTPMRSAAKKPKANEQRKQARGLGRRGLLISMKRYVRTYITYHLSSIHPSLLSLRGLFLNLSRASKVDVMYRSTTPAQAPNPTSASASSPRKPAASWKTPRTSSIPEWIRWIARSRRRHLRPRAGCRGGLGGVNDFFLALPEGT